MRVATAFSYQQAIANLQRRQEDLSESQNRLTSGKRVLLPSDDPVAARRVERALAVEARVDATKRAAQASLNAMTLAESALGGANDILQAIRDAAVAAGNGAYGDKERAILAQQIQQYRDQLLGMANRTDAAGNPLFGGAGVTGDPFVPNGAGRVEFWAAPGSVGVDNQEILPVTVDGAYAWDATPGLEVPIFKTLDDFIVQLRTGGMTSAAVSSAVQTALGGIDAGMERLQAARAQVGDTLNRIDAIVARLDALDLNAKTDRSNAEDLDMVAAISDFQNKQTGYDAALKTYAQVQRLSLFDYLR